jgi:hypothetical protein
VIVRDTSVAVSMARSAMPGCESSGWSLITFCNSLRFPWPLPQAETGRSVSNNSFVFNNSWADQLFRATVAGSMVRLGTFAIARI